MHERGSSRHIFILILQEKRMSELSQHEQIVQAFNQYLTEAETFDEKGVKAAAARARKALGDLGKLSKSRRAEIQEKKNNM